VPGAGVQGRPTSAGCHTVAMHPRRVALLTLLAMLAFAGNSLLTRAALRDTAIDAASFTAIRIVSGAVALWALVRIRNGSTPVVRAGSWGSALALFAYAAAFSLAYLSLTAATGALLLFAAVQVTMIGVGLVRGERLTALQGAGLVLAFAGLVGMLLPGLSAPPLAGALLMVVAGAAWGAYSLRGRRATLRGTDATTETAGNFVRAAPMALALLGVAWAVTGALHVDPAGVCLALASGALTSGMGYALWYAALRGLTAATAASVQLSVPVITAVAGVVLLSEPLTARLVLASAAVLGGIALVIRGRAAATSPPSGAVRP
jgi:drug/metabolite transporter (DMT)-like permease